MLSINVKGYINSYDLMDDIKYPNLSKVLKGITKKNDKGLVYDYNYWW